MRRRSAQGQEGIAKHTRSPLVILRIRYSLGLFSRTPSPLSPAGMNSTPALANAFSTAVTVLSLEFTLPFSIRVTAFNETMALSASSC